MRYLISLIENAQKFGVPTVLYHGTKPANVESILTKGLSAEHDQSWKHFGQGVYLSHCAAHAKGYGDAVFAVDLSKLDIRKLVADDDDLEAYFNGAWGDGDEGDYADDEERPSGIFEASWLDSLRICGQCQYLGSIPPEALAVTDALNT